MTAHLETLRIGDLASIKRGVTYSASDDVRDIESADTVRLLRSTNIQAGRITLDDVHIIDAASASTLHDLHHGDLAVCIANGSRSLVGKAALFEEEGSVRYVVGAFCARLRPRSGESSALLAAILESSPYRRWIDALLAGTNIGNLRPDDIISCPIRLPSEQSTRNAWGDLLGDCRRVVTLLSTLINAKQWFKRGLMQELLTGRRRFPEYVGRRAWRSSSLGKLAAGITRRNAGRETELVLTCSGLHGLIDQRDYFTKTIAGDSLEDYFLVRRGEFAYNRSSMSGYPYGAIKRLDRYNAGLLSTLNICFAIHGEDWLSDFAVHYFESGLLNHALGRITRIGSRAHGLLNVTKADFFALKVPVPDIDEQERIAGVLTALDTEITSLQAMLSAHESLKRGLMQKLLSGDIEVPQRLGTNGRGPDHDSDARETDS